MHNERGLQNKSSDTSRQLWEGGEFPLVCGPYQFIFYTIVIECAAL